MTERSEGARLLEPTPEGGEVVRIVRGRKTNLLYEPANPEHIVLPPAYEIDRTGKVLYTFDLRLVDEDNPLEYTITDHYSNKELYRLECSTNTADTLAWKISRDGTVATEIATINHSLKQSTIKIRHNACGSETPLGRNKDFNSCCGNGGKQGKLNWRNSTTFSSGRMISVDLECRDYRGWFDKEDRAYWAFIGLDADNPFTRLGKIEIVHSAPSQEAVDELVITGFAFMMLVKRAISRAAKRIGGWNKPEKWLSTYIEKLEPKDFEDD